MTKLSVKVKLQILQEIDKKCLSQQKIARKYEVSRGAIRKIAANKGRLLSYVEENKNVNAKYITTKYKFPQLETGLLEWLNECRRRKLPVSCELLKAQARKIVGSEDFSASNGWLDSWMKRHNIKSVYVSCILN